MINATFNFKRPDTFKNTLILFVVLLFSQISVGQYSVSGPSTSNVDEIKDYSISGSGPSYGKTVWYANGGTVVSFTLSTVRVRWTQAGNRTVGVTIWYNPVDSSPEAYPSKSVTVLSNDPPIAYTLTNTGPSEVCTNNGAVRLSDSQVGATYRLYRNGSAYGSVISGTNNALNWSGLSAGTYTARATMNGQTVVMNGSITISTKTATPVTINTSVPDNNNICPGTTVTIATNGSGPSWSGTDNNNTVTSLTLSAGQTRTVSVTATDDCGALQSTSITLRAASAIGTVSISSGVSTRCKGSGTTDYNVSAANASSYSWSISPASAGSINSSGTVTWSSSYAGNATITATASNSCGQSRNGNRTVTVNNPPTVYSLAGPSSLCSGNTGTVTLSDSQSGVNYQLYRNNVQSGTAKSGTNNAISWTGVSSGTYRVEATNSNGNCGTINMGNQVTIDSTTATPITINTSVPDNNNICPGTTVTIATNGSGPSWTGTDNNNTVTSVTLTAGQTRTVSVSATDNCGDIQSTSITLKATSAIGTVNISSGLSTRCKGSGTTDYNVSAANASGYSWEISPSAAGSINSSGTVTWSSSYAGNATITATATNSCGQSRSGNRTVTISNPPTAYALSAPAEVCSTGTITLADSQSGVNYQLYKNNAENGSVKPGTGAALTWSGAGAGTYKVEATNSNGNCGVVNMANQVTIGSTSASAIEITVGVSDINNICAGTQIALSSNGTSHSWSGVDGYITGNNPAYVNLAPGETRTISVTATDDCGTSGTDSVTLTAQSAPSGASITTGPLAICQGTPSSDYNASATNASEFSWTISPSSAGQINESGTVQWTSSYVGNVTITYTASNSCSQSDSDSVTVSVSTSPVSTYTLSGSGQLCSGQSGTITLSDSQSNVNYRLIKNDTQTIATISGTGNAISWSNNTITSGAYKVEATNANGICNTVEMANVFTINEDSTADPITINVGVTNENVICANTQIIVSANGSGHTWSGVDGYITGNNPAYVNLSPGESRTITVTAINGCGISETDTITLQTTAPVGNVSINEDIQTRCQGPGTDTYTAIATNADSYSWGITAGAGTVSNQGVVLWDENFFGDAIISVTANNGCGNTTIDYLRVSTITEKTYYRDEDRDGYSTGAPVVDCSNPDPSMYRDAAFITGAGDCDDTNEFINPSTIWRLNADGDAHAAPGENVQGCTPPNTTDYTYDVLPDDDCDDTDNTVFGAPTWFLDADGDNAPANNDRFTQCDSPGAGYRNFAIANNAAVDCNDNDANIKATKWYLDTDQDGLGDANGEVRQQCTPPTQGGPWVDNKSDFCPGVQDPDNLCGAIVTSGDGINYVYTRNYQEERTSPTAFFTEDTGLIQNVTYYDGIGRPIQQVAIDQSPTATAATNDLISHMAYDGFGRMEKEWLPYAEESGTMGSLRLDAEQSIQDFYNTEKYEYTTNPYNEKRFENSPLSRVLKQGAPGNDWQILDNGDDDHSLEFKYLTNAANEVKRFEVTLETTPTLTVDEGGANAFYFANELQKTITYDENHVAGKNHSIEEFKDKMGRVILKRTYADVTNSDASVSAAEPHDTYYVYDDFGNLSFVLPPKMDATTSSLSQINGNLDALGYQYRYDNRNRVIEKKIPSSGWEYIIYNRLDKPIMSQDANQRLTNEWLFSKYDAFGRVAYTGKALDTSTREAIQTEVNALFGDVWVNKGVAEFYGGATVHYNNGAYPITALTEVLTINYYDDYDFDRAGAPLSAMAFNVASSDETKSLVTGNKIKVLETEDWITTVTYYDNKARPIYNYSNNTYLNTTNIVTTKFDFGSKPLKSRIAHTRNNSTVVTLDNFTYDNSGRLLTHTQCIGDNTLLDNCLSVTDSVSDNIIIEDVILTTDRVATNSITVRPTATLQGTVTLSIDPNANTSGSGSTNEELIVSNTYDNLGLLTIKSIGGSFGSSSLQNINFKYNIRGWLTDINDVEEDITSDKLFNFKISYNQGLNPLYNGNISTTQWRTDNVDKQLKSYNYQYDALNRITDATSDSDNRYGLGHMRYDKNGNILALQREGHVVENPIGTNNAHFDTMDDLDYDYSGNQLLAVTDAVGNFGFNDRNKSSNDYRYDANGNMVMDKNKGIGSETAVGIIYNHLNLPVSITINNSENNGTISYTYDATGVKQDKIAGDEVIEYAGNYIYKNGGLQSFGVPDGYVQPNNNGSYDYIYQFKDHLGNIRLSFTDSNDDGIIDSSDEIVQENNFYPYGLEHKGYNNQINSTEYLFKYNGKELNEELGIGWYDFGARNYNAVLGRWMNLDPLADKYFNVTPYSFVSNTPINAIDPDGRRVYYVAGAGNDKDGWDYVNRTKKAFEAGGISGFTRVNSSGGNLGPLPIDDMTFSSKYRNSSSAAYPSGEVHVTQWGSYPIYVTKIVHETDPHVKSAAKQIRKDLKDNPLAEDEQFNLAGYSYGSVLQAHVALEISKTNVIDNLILIGSPISDNSSLYKELSENKNIKNIVRVDIENDLLSNPKDVGEFLQGVLQNSPSPIGEGDAAPHFNLARPGKEVDKKIKEMVAYLVNQRIK